MTPDQLAAKIPDGAKICVPPDYAGVAMELTRAMVRRGVKDLHLVCVPVSGLQAELLIGSGAIKTLETSAITLGRFDVAGVMLFYAVYLASWGWLTHSLGAGRFAWLGIALGAAQALWHFGLIRERARAGCFKAFRLNHWLGASVFAGIALDYALR